MMPNSLKYIALLSLTAVCHALMPKRGRNALLLAASWLFYLLSMPKYLPLLIVVTGATFLTAKWMENHPDRKRFALTAALLGCFGLLYLYKYLAFTGQLLSMLPGVGTIELPQLVQPLGISFYLFCVTGYLIDVYRGAAAEKSFVDYSLMVSFFPAVLSGPIARSKGLLPQLKDRTPGWMDVKRGITRFLVGMAKKMLLADVLSAMVATVYADVAAFTGPQVIFAAICYSLQIYCDFSSYSDMAVGAGLLFGIRLMENFDTPYFAQSIPELWRRWHISLSSWFRDYLYFPLGGSRKGRLRTNLNLMIVFAVSGLWHGAAWTFVIWGALHGFYQVIGILLKKPKSALYAKLGIDESAGWVRAMRCVITFILVDFAWIFFRANSFADLRTLMVKLFTDWEWNVSYFAESFSVMGLSAIGVGISLMAIYLMNRMDCGALTPDPLPEGGRRPVLASVHYTYFLWAIAAAWLILLAGDGASSFIYFQF